MFTPVEPPKKASPRPTVPQGWNNSTRVHKAEELTAKERWKSLSSNSKSRSSSRIKKTRENAQNVLPLNASSRKYQVPFQTDRDNIKNSVQTTTNYRDPANDSLVH